MLQEAKHGRSEETEKYQEEIATLNEEMKKLKLQVQEKTEEVHVAEHKALAIRKQSESMLLEYDRLLEDNQHLREQLQSIDLRLSYSSGKKNIQVQDYPIVNLLLLQQIIRYSFGENSSLLIPQGTE